MQEVVVDFCSALPAGARVTSSSVYAYPSPECSPMRCDDAAGSSFGSDFCNFGSKKMGGIPYFCKRWEECDCAARRPNM